jgi:hypothetical protein
MSNSDGVAKIPKDRTIEWVYHHPGPFFRVLPSLLSAERQAGSRVVPDAWREHAAKAMMQAMRRHDAYRV